MKVARIRPFPFFMWRTTFPAELVEKLSGAPWSYVRSANHGKSYKFRIVHVGFRNLIHLIAVRWIGNGIRKYVPGILTTYTVKFCDFIFIQGHFRGGGGLVFVSLIYFIFQTFRHMFCFVKIIVSE